MKTRKWIKNQSMEKAVLTVLTFIAVFGLVACGDSSKDSGGSGTSGRGSDRSMEEGGDREEQEESTTDPETKQTQEKLTLAGGKAKLIYRNGSYICVAYYGPCDGASFAHADGEFVSVFLGYGRPSDNWTIIQSTEFPAELAAEEDVLLWVEDESAEKNADGTYQQGVFPMTETLTKEEAVEIGLSIVADHICMVSTDKPTYAWNNFTAPLCTSIIWMNTMAALLMKSTD